MEGHTDQGGGQDGEEKRAGVSKVVAVMGE